MNNTHDNNYIELKEELMRIGHLTGILSLAHWDQATFMPKGAIDSRGEQLAILSQIVHEKSTGLCFAQKLAKCVDLKDGKILLKNLSPKEQAMLNETYESYKKDSALSPQFVSEFTALTSKAQAVWEEARLKDDFSMLSPLLKKIVKMNKEMANLLNPNISAYDALMDLYEPGVKSADINPLFNELKKGILGLLDEIRPHLQKRNFPFLEQKFCIQKQKEFGLSILKTMGLSEEYSRLDISTHPFCTNFHPTDVRLTTRLDPLKLIDGLGSTMHEGGHALYELGLPVEWFGTPLSKAVSMGLHESQSRLWENLVGLSLNFWKYQLPKLKEFYPQELNQVDLKEFYYSINQVRPGLIRVESDELTYNLHIMVRYEIEQNLINDNLDVDELPEIWNKKYQEYLGITPSSNREGVLQDVHWPGGSFGYFPTYTLGNLYSVQFFEAAKKDIKNFDSTIEVGELFHLRNWLKEQIHCKGRELKAQDLIKNVTGKNLETTPFINYLRQKYLPIYCER